ncbi:MAG: putative tail fiber protein [Prokaryotic dsDNA virus sp.]|nr:MAG: putative tail fiber protein [Prokaryotic dsDNA virus sp.]
MVKEIGDSTTIDTWAATGTKQDPGLSKTAQGWSLGEKPPFEFMNWIQNVFGKKLNHMLSWGIARWNGSTTYLTGAAVGHNGSLWVALADNTGSEPSGGNSNWSTISTGTSPTQSQEDWNGGVIQTESLISPEKLRGAVAEQTGLTGMVAPFAMSTAPGGWLECDGSAVSRSVYANLFSTIGTVHGAGNGSTTFNLPDLRGEFIRGWDHGRGIDPSRGFASEQDYATAPPQTTSVERLLGDGSTEGLRNATNPSAVGFSRVSKTGEGITVDNRDANDSGKEPDSINVVTGDDETRPRNVALMYCIKT